MMPWHVDATLVGSIGVALLLVAFLLNLARVLRSDEWPYLGLNVIGAGLACYSSYLIPFMPFVVLEGTWAAVALVGLVRKLTLRVVVLSSGSRRLRCRRTPGAADGKDIPDRLALTRVGRERQAEPRCASGGAGPSRIRGGTEHDTRAPVGRRQDGPSTDPCG